MFSDSGVLAFPWATRFLVRTLFVMALPKTITFNGEGTRPMHASVR